MQASTRMIRINVDVERGNGHASTFVRRPPIWILIGGFISIIAFYLGCPFRVVVCYSLSVPGNSGRSSRKISERRICLIRLRHGASAFLQPAASKGASDTDLTH